VIRLVHLFIVVVPAGVHHPADGARVEDEIGLPQLQMELRVGPLLAAEFTIGAILGTPLCLRHGGASLPVDLISTAQIHREGRFICTTVPLECDSFGHRCFKFRRIVQPNPPPRIGS
jgi:hypothetical protein